MTWNDLKEALSTFTADQLNQDVTVYVSGVDEYYGLVSDYPLNEAQSEVNDQLDTGHKYLVI